MMSSAQEQARQYLLPFTDSPEFEAVNLEQGDRQYEDGKWFQGFVLAYIRLDGNGTQAVHEADAALGRKQRPDGAAAKCASKYVKRPAVASALQESRAKAAREAGIELTEFHAGLRLLHGQASGQIPVRKTLVMAHKGEILTEDADVYEPNMAASGKALEMMGKSLGVFIDRTELTGRDGQPLDLSETKRAARIASIFEAARLRQDQEQTDTDEPAG